MALGQVPLTIAVPAIHHWPTAMDARPVVSEGAWWLGRPRVRLRRFALECATHTREGGVGILRYHGHDLRTVPESLSEGALQAAVALHPRWHSQAYELRGLFGPLPRGRFQEFTYDSGARALAGVLKVDAYRVAPEWGYVAVFFHPKCLGWVVVSVELRESNPNDG